MSPPVSGSLAEGLGLMLMKLKSLYLHNYKRVITHLSQKKNGHECTCKYTAKCNVYLPGSPGHDCALQRERRVISSKSTAVVQNIDISGVREGESYALQYYVYACCNNQVSHAVVHVRH